LLWLLLRWSLLRRRSLYQQTAVSPRLPCTTRAIEPSEYWCRLQLWRRMRYVVRRTHWLMGKARTPLIVWRRWTTCCKLLGLHWGIRYRRRRRLWATDHVAEEVTQVPGLGLRRIGCGSKRRCYALTKSSCSKKAICLPYPTNYGWCRGVQNRPAAIPTHQLVTQEALSIELTR
jgi:hypothetical protein